MKDLSALEKDLEEMEKCKNDPVYFYNTYVRKEGMRELTKEEYEALSREVMMRRNGTKLKLRSQYKDRLLPLTPSEAFPPFLIK